MGYTQEVFLSAIYCRDKGPCRLLIRLKEFIWLSHHGHNQSIMEEIQGENLSKA